MIRLELPYPVSANRYWRHAVIGGRAAVFISAEGKAYKKTVGLLARVQGVRKPTEKQVGIRYLLSWPLYRKDGSRAGNGIDLSNAIKIAEDALQGIVYLNDRQVKSFSADYAEPTKNGGLTIEISEFIAPPYVISDQKTLAVETSQPRAENVGYF